MSQLKPHLSEMHPNEQLIHDFYAAFNQMDWQAMGQCYTSEAHFNDPVFCDLKGADVTAMWHMLCERAEDFDLDLRDVSADDERGSARWDAYYTFARTGRRVHNVVFAEFQFTDGRISRHSDHFSFWRWSSMALGPVGRWFGWSGLLKRKVQRRATAGLSAFKRKNM